MALQHPHRLPAVGERVFLFDRNLGQGDLKTVGHEDGIVAETLHAFAFPQGDMPFAGAFEYGKFTVFNQGNDATEACGTFFEWKALEFFQHTPPVCGRIFVFPGITCRVNARRTAECIDFEPGVVGEAVLLE